MVAWFRKGIGVTAAGNAVSRWGDLSGNAHDYTQPTGAAQPSFLAGGTILFNGTSNALQTGAFALTQPYTRYLRVRQITWTSLDAFFDGTTPNGGALYQNGASPNISLYAGSFAAANAALAVNTWGSVAAVFNGALSVLNVNGTETNGDTGANNPGGLTLGSYGTIGGTQQANIEVAEEIVYGVAHDAITRASIIAYLNTL